MKDKVAELRKILSRKKAVEQQGQPFDEGGEVGEAGERDRIQNTGDSFLESATQTQEKQKGFQVKKEEENGLFGGIDPQEIEKLRVKCEELTKANETQKDMYLRKAAEFENFKKRLQREHDEFVKFALEKFLNEVLPVIDGLESTLDHASPDDPIFSGVSLTLKQFLQVLEKFGVQQITGVGQTFDPHTQEAIGTQKDEKIASGSVVTVHRKGYVLNGKVVRAASVTVAE